MKKHILTVAALGLAVLVTVVAIPQRARAITLIPPTLEFSVKKGDIISTKVKLFNETTDPLTYYAQTANFDAKNETGTPDIQLENGPIDLASWVSLAAGPFAVQPGERVEIPVEIKVPENADPGGHYASILFSTDPPSADTTGGSSVQITQKIGTLVLVRVEGDISESASVVDFSTEGKKTSYSRLPINFDVRVQNSGNIHLRPTGSITVRNMLGGTSAIIPINSAQGAVLPQSIRKFTGAWEKGTAPTSSNFFSEFANEWKNFGFGTYTATVELTYGQANDKVLNGTYRLMIFPWRVLLLWLIIIVLVIWTIVKLVKHYNTWIIKRSGQPGPKK